MKIVRLIQEYPKEINRGLAPNVYYISKEQVRQGHEVWIFSFTQKKPSHELVDGINIFRIKKPPLLRWFGGIFFFLAIIKEKINPDIIHGLQPISFGWFFPIIRHAIKTKYILSLHCSILPLKHDYVSGLKNKFQNLEFTLLSRLIAKRIDFILPVANFIKNELIGINIPENKIETIPSGINYDLFLKNINITSNNNLFTVLFVGRFVQMKGITYLVKALYKLSKSNIKLILIGGHTSDDEYNKILKLIKRYNLNNKIEIINTMPQENIIKYYHSSNVFILPSIYEPRGKVLLEAMASGLPVIATNSGGTTETVSNQLNGILIPPKDEDAIAEAILKIKDNTELRNTIIKNGYKTAKTYDWKIISDNYSKVFNNILQNAYQ